MFDHFNHNQINKTNIVDSKSFEERIAIELYRVVRNKTSLSLLKLGFKPKVENLSPTDLNNITTIVIEVMNKNVRNIDAITEGDYKNYTIMLADTDTNGAKIVAERIVSDLHHNTICAIEVFIGISSYPSDCISYKELLQAANYSMIQAKELKNCPVLSIEEVRKGISWKHEIIPYVKHTKTQFNKILFLTAGALLSTFQESKRYLETHSLLSAKLAIAIAQQLNLPANEVENIALAALLHDIGNMNISHDILRKTNKLTDNDLKEIYKHPEYALHNVLKNSMIYDRVFQIILDHHEAWDGSGYPNARQGYDIHLGARILTIADSFIALISERSYRKAYSHEEAIAIMKEEVNVKFDQDLFDIFLQIASNKKDFHALLNMSSVSLSSIMELVNS